MTRTQRIFSLSRGLGQALCVALMVAAGAPTSRTIAEGEETAGDKGRKPNRLIHEKSPYLLQHAYNPVDWYPWGKAAFQKARKENKPVFLSIGYSTCHWCHVMERESFENAAIAAILNEHFVCIKVDREERPDVDGVYMDFVQAMNRRGGWPLSAFLMPDGKPFFGGTYFQPAQFTQLINSVHSVWIEKKETIREQADRISEHLRSQQQRSRGEGELDSRATDGVFSYLDQLHDAEHGGFSGPPRFAPKFPRTSNLDFLLRYAKRTGTKRAEEMVYTTLDHMIAGGIRDHLAGGFHRYSTDRVWLLPHFEKMLYDNALISRTLLDAYRVGGNERYRDVAVEALDYVLTRMQDPGGGFRSAEDADADHVEGLTYIWGRDEVLGHLGSKDGELFCEYYGVRSEGNFKEERPDPRTPHHQNVLHVAAKESIGGGEAAFAKKKGIPADELGRRLADSRAKLLALRAGKPQPLLDDKVLVEWNGLMISAMAHAYQVTGQERFLVGARKAAGFIAREMVRDGKLMRRYKDGEVKIQGFFEDHAFLIDGLLDLYESDFDRRWLEFARKLGKDMVAFFWDPKSGAFYSSAAHHEALILRRQEFYDGALPSGNSVAFLDLLRLKELTQDGALDEPIARLRKIAGGLLRKSPHMHPQLACAAEFLLSDPLEIVIVGALDDPATKAMLAELRRRFLPGKVVGHADSAESADGMKSLVPLMEAKLAIGGNTTAFVCRQQVCRLPARDLAAFRRQLDEVTKSRTVSEPAPTASPGSAPEGSP